MIDPKEIERLVELDKEWLACGSIRGAYEAHEKYCRALIVWFRANYPALLEMQKDAENQTKVVTYVITLMEVEKNYDKALQYLYAVRDRLDAAIDAKLRE